MPLQVTRIAKAFIRTSLQIINFGMPHHYTSPQRANRALVACLYMTLGQIIIDS
jgi:hypothetical protein